MTRAATARTLDEAQGVRAMVWIIAVMLFLTVLATALGIATANAADALGRQLAGRLSVQVALGDPAARDAAAERAARMLRDLPGVRQVTPVPRADLVRLLEPWLGSDADDSEIPIPAMIDVDLTDTRTQTVDAVRTALLRDVPAARVEQNARWMSPVSGFLDLVTWLAFGLALLMAAATALVVVLAARAGLESHRATIEVMHMLGSTDVQVARLFQRRIARDALIGGGAGAVLALAMVALIGWRAQGLGSELLGGMALGTTGWIVLALLPLAFVVLATLSARIAVTATLARAL